MNRSKITESKKRVGITTTVPVEVILAAGHMPVDLNNAFVTSSNAHSLVDVAERAGFPKSCCAWIKGIYGAVRHTGIESVIGVVEGDCSNTKALLDVLGDEGIERIPFAFPHGGSREVLAASIIGLMDHFGVSEEAVEYQRQGLMNIRSKLARLDALSWRESKVGGFENHLFQVSASDFDGDPATFETRLDRFLEEAEGRVPIDHTVRLAFIGVPPMMADLYFEVESHGGLVVYNEVQREFAMPRAMDHQDIVSQYLDYTYPYDFEVRCAEVIKQLELRQVDAVIHYTQSFCHKGIENILYSKRLGMPVLNIEGDRDVALDGRTRLRLEAFIDMMKDRLLYSREVVHGK